MLRGLFLAIIGVPLALVIVGAGAAFSLPMTRHMISGLWNGPDRLPALSTNADMHYQPGAADFAREVEALYPDAVARVEAVHGRRFAQPVTVAAYATAEAYAAANGVGSDIPVGVTFVGRVNLSPKLFSQQHRRLRAILTHELSHAHIQGWIGELKYICLPNWFREGLAVLVSEGGGAELVSEAEARAAIGRGERLIIDDALSLPISIEVRLEKAPVNKPACYPVVLAYREAGMFLNYLRESDRPAFDRMMNTVLDGQRLREAVAVSYHNDVRSLWETFLKSSSDPK